MCVRAGKRDTRAAPRRATISFISIMLPSACRGTVSSLQPHAQHLSPAVGLALSAGGAHLLSHLYGLQPRVPIAPGARGQRADGSSSTWAGSAVGALSRELFHRTHPHEPLRPTANRSLPAAHLSPSLCAAVVGLAWERPGSSAVYQALRQATCSDTQLGVPKLARETGVSIARFERLVELVMRADDELESPLSGRMGSSLVLRLLWMRATTRGELWTYLRALDASHDALTAAARADGEAGFVAMPKYDARELDATAVEEAARALLVPHAAEDARSAASPACASAQAHAFEVVAAALALGGTHAAPLNQGRYGYMGQPAVADCAELCARELLNTLLWDAAAQRFDVARLPARALPALRAFYDDGGGAYHDPRGGARNTGGTSADDALWGSIVSERRTLALRAASERPAFESLCRQAARPCTARRRPSGSSSRAACAACRTWRARRARPSTSWRRRSRR